MTLCKAFRFLQIGQDFLEVYALELLRNRMKIFLYFCLGMDQVVSEMCYKGTILPRNFISFVKTPW